MIFILKFAKTLVNTFVAMAVMLNFSYAPVQIHKVIEVKTETKEEISETEVMTEQKDVQVEEIKTEVMPARSKSVTSRGGVERQEFKKENSMNFATPCYGKKSQGYSGKHPAVDIYNSYGTEIYSALDGVCVKVKYSNVSYGNHIVIEHENGYKTLYAHLSDIIIEENQSVKSGELIGYMGSTGNSTGNHLHFEIHNNGIKLNPLKYIQIEH